MARMLVGALLAATCAGWSHGVHASEPHDEGLGPEWVQIGPGRLADLRGGYVLPSGLQLSFGIERIAYVNGQMVSHLSVNIPDVSNISTAQAEELAQLTRTQLVQIGPGNVYQDAGNAGLVIQNSLDGQDIRAQTTLNVSVDTLGMLQAINAADALRNANYMSPGAP